MQNNNSDEMIEHLKQVARAMNVDVTEAQTALFGQYYNFLLEYNQKVNLTRITEPREVAVKHFGDSFAVLAPKILPLGSSVADVGSGAGFPGIPVAIMRSDLQLTLVDSLRKRTVFLSELVQLLGLQNVNVVWARAEEIGHNPAYRGKFDVVMARAVASLNVLSELCLPLTKPGGLFLAMKGPKAEDELRLAKGAISKLGGFLISAETQSLPLVGETRTLITIGKKHATAAVYPRKAGIPERQPLS
jgi:16S rRNA (guanine527-N7)-methyltransferase